LKFFLNKTKPKTLKTNLIITKLQNQQILKFKNFLFKDGFLTKNIIVFGKIIQKINSFIFLNKKFLYENYNNIHWYFDNIFYKNLNFLSILQNVINLINPPFIIKSTTIPKKLKKQIKTKYFIKIVYNKENKRLNSSFKQLYYYSNKFTDTKYKIRLYKSLIFTFLD
jgi:hypothetical protein